MKERTTYLIAPTVSTGLYLWGKGVCKKCWLGGFGKNGKYGKLMKAQLTKEEQQINKNSDKIPLRINGKLRLATKIIEIKTL